LHLIRSEHTPECARLAPQLPEITFVAIDLAGLDFDATGSGRELSAFTSTARAMSVAR
jgi:hypothetical protein